MITPNRILSCLLLAASGLGAFPGAENARALVLDHGAADPAVSPDGSTIAFSAMGRLFLLPIRDKSAVQITESAGWDGHPAWSPDGQFIAYAHEGPADTDLAIYNRADGTTSFLYHTADRIGQIAFASNGADLFFLITRNQLDSHLWRIPRSGGEAKQITFTKDWHEWSFALSPGAKEVVLDSGRFGGSNLYRLTTDGTKLTRLTRSPAHQTNVALTKDGATLVYVQTEEGVDSIISSKPDGSNAHAVFHSPYDQKQISLFPDGKSLVLCAGRRLYRVDLASGSSTPIPFEVKLELPKTVKPDLVITHARIFTGVGDAVIANSTLLVRDGRIAEIRPGDERGLPKDIPVLDAAGKFVMAGLMDNHYHYWGAFDGGQLLQRGITAIRDPGVAISTSMQFQEAIRDHITPGPRIYSCGPLIDGPGGYHPLVDVEIDRPESAAPLVKALKDQGASCLKVYFLLRPEVLKAVLKEAKAQNLPVTGHIGVRTGWEEAVESGIDGLSHIRVWRDFLSLDKQPQGENESLDASKNLVARMQADWTEIDPDGPGATKLLQSMAADHVGFDPTLTIQRVRDAAKPDLSLEQFAETQEAYKRMSRFVARAHQLGVTILSGTDDGDLFDELEAYAEAGIPKAEVLRTATVQGAKWLKQDGDFGTIEPGKRADLIVVDGDPLKDMKDLRKIQVVVQNGRVVFRK